MTQAESATRTTGYEPITAEERAQYHEQGYLVIPNALDETMRSRLEKAVDQIYDEEKRADRLRPDKSIHVMGFFPRDPIFTELLDYPTTFPYIWGLMGWNIYSHHNHIDVNPPITEPGDPFWNWHQDGYRQNADVDMNPRPMFMTKICYLLSDLSVTGRGATQIIPGSHVNNTLAGRPEKPGDPVIRPEGAVEIQAKAGDAFIFDRRLWHSRSVNLSELTRKHIFIGYTYRWIRPLDEVTPDFDSDWFTSLNPLQQQLLGYGNTHSSFWGIKPDGWIDKDLPLRKELADRGLLDKSTSFLR